MNMSEQPGKCDECYLPQGIALFSDYTVYQNKKQIRICFKCFLKLIFVQKLLKNDLKNSRFMKYLNLNSVVSLIPI